MREHEEARLRYISALTEWESESTFARKLLNGEAMALKEIIEESQAIFDNDLVGQSIAFSISDSFVHAKIHVHSDEIIPNFRRKKLSSGKLSETKMPVTQFNELYQDYVASVALKIGGTLLNLIPISEVYITCLTHMLDTQTGHQKVTPILSVQLVRETWNRLNLQQVDPSDALANFKHTMAFKKTKGFDKVSALKPLS